MRTISLVTAFALLTFPAGGAFAADTTPGGGLVEGQAKTAGGSGQGQAAPSGQATTTVPIQPSGASSSQPTREGCPTATGQGADRSGEASKRDSGQAQC
jgi:hypothetical protein